NKGIEARSAIINGAIPYSQKIVSSLAHYKEVGPESIQAILRKIFATETLDIFFWQSPQALKETVSKRHFSQDFAQYSKEVFRKGSPDWFEDELDDRDIAVSLIPLMGIDHLEGVFCLVFDMSTVYSQLDISSRLSLSIESSKLQEQQLREAEKHRNQLKTRRQAQRELLATNKRQNVQAIKLAGNRLMGFLGATMVVLMAVSLFLFWWLGTRRITILKNWLAKMTEGNLSAWKTEINLQNATADRAELTGSKRKLPDTGDSKSDLTSQRVVATTDDEIGDLGNSINLMLDSLDQTTVSKNLLMREIEERKKIESQLLDNQQRLKTILNAVQAGVVLIDAESRTIVSVNPAAEALIGVGSQDIVGRTCYNFICPAQQHNCPIDDLGETINNSQKTLLTASGKELPIIKTETEITLGGKRHFIASFVDITDLQQARQKLEQATSAAERASAVKSQFLANMSHEIRTPLNGVLGMSEIALESGLSDEQKTIVSTISKEAKSLLRIINDILDFSKIEAGKMEIETIPFDLYSLCEEVVQSIIYTGEQKGLEIIFFIEPNIPPMLQGDPGRIRQVLKNLCGNALKFTSEGEVYIKVALQEDYGEGVRLLFSIKDSGIGIAPEKLETIFESFTQADGTTTRLYGGTGLGTAISKQLVELMGGEINVESKPGQGSTFKFLLPLLKSQTADITLLAPQPKLEGIRVLIVDDNPTNLFILEEYLNAWGCIPQKAANGGGALTLFKKAMTAGLTAFDLVITDYNMPILDGFSFVEEIRNFQKNGQQVPVIVFSSPSTSKGAEKNWAGLAVSSFINKPILRQDLKRAVCEALNLQTKKTPAHHIDQSMSAPEVSENEGKKYHILLAEDYPTNRIVAANYLTKAGYQVDLVENGREAVLFFQQNTYDLILMDIQMPVLDGYGATFEIREYESSKPAGTKIPIIAMTAHAMSGYREKCLAGGMDDYITKPLKRREFLETVKRWLPQNPDNKKHVADKPASGPEVDTDGPVDMEKLFKEMEGDQEIILALFDSFSESLSTQKSILQQAVSAGDCKTIRNEAHSIKGAAANVAAFKLSAIAKKLEALGDRAAHDEIPPVFTQFLSEVETFIQFAQKYKGEHDGLNIANA
nr:response regulator [Desulfobulbaceae bacterium]